MRCTPYLLLFLLSLGVTFSVQAQVYSHTVNPDHIPAELIGSAYAQMLVEAPEGTSTSNSAGSAAICTQATKATLKNAGSKVVGGKATLVVPAGTCPVQVSFTSYMLPKGSIRPFEAQVVFDNVTATYGPGTHTINVNMPACGWQSDLYLGPLQAQLIPNVGHISSTIFAWAYKQGSSLACATASLGNYIWVDSNDNGRQDASESGVDGVTVKLFKSDGTLAAQQVTAGGGAYLFTGLLPGSYYVVVSNYPALYRIARQNDAGDDAMDSDLDSAGVSDLVVLTVGMNYRDLDGGLVVNGVRPVLEGVFAECDGSYRAVFGYLNEAAIVVNIPVGTNNRFSPLPQDRGQTTAFQPGRVNSAFTVAWDGSAPLVWTLKGPDGRQRTSTAGTNTAAPAQNCICDDPTSTATYAGGYVLNSAETRAFVEVMVPAGGTTFEFYSTRNLVVGAPENAAETVLTGVTRTSDTFTFSPASPTVVRFPISRLEAEVARVAFFLRVTDSCGRTVDVDPDFTLTGVAGDEQEAFGLAQNLPNPFAGQTQIAFSLGTPSDVRLALYDVLGREVAVLAQGMMEAGSHHVRFDAASLPAGQYLYRLSAGSQTQTRVLTVAR